ncbi:TPA: autotransporter domain-containing protein, partial [Escherichia coli]|nr:autotransporter domain-containing protein [Escherichia coli]
TPDAALSRAVAKGDSPVTFHKLTTSNLTGQGGTINMRVRLDGSNTSDQLVINGGQATGKTWLAFTNVGNSNLGVATSGQGNAGYVKFGHGSTQHVRAGFRLGSHNDMTFGEGTSSRDTLRDSTKHRVSELPVNWWVQPSVIRTFSSRGDMSMGTAAAGSNMTFSPSRNGTSLDLQAGLEARVRENITLGVQAGYAHSVSGSSAEGYNGQATLNVTF